MKYEVFRNFLLFIILAWIASGLSITSSLQAQLTGQQLLVSSIAKSGDGHVIAANYNDFTMRGVVDFFDSNSGLVIDTADLKPYSLHLIDLSPTGDRLVWIDGSSNIGIYDRNSQVNEVIIPGGPFFVEYLDWSPVDNVIGWTQGSSITFYDVLTRTNLGTIISDAEKIVAFAWSADGRQIATSHFSESNPGQRNSTVQIWDVSTLSGIMSKPHTTIENRGGGRIGWSPDSTRIAVIERGGFLVYDTGTTDFDQITFNETGGISVIEWSPDGNRIATGGFIIRIWNTSTWQLEREIENRASALQWAGNSAQVFNNGGQNGLYLDNIPLIDYDFAPTPNADLRIPIVDA